MAMPMDMESLAKTMVKPGGPKEPEPGESDQGPDVGVEAAAEELLAAVQAGDAKGVASALRNAVQMCMTEYEK